MSQVCLGELRPLRMAVGFPWHIMLPFVSLKVRQFVNPVRASFYLSSGMSCIPCAQVKWHAPAVLAEYFAHRSTPPAMKSTLQIVGLYFNTNPRNDVPNPNDVLPALSNRVSELRTSQWLVTCCFPSLGLQPKFQAM